MAALFHKNAGHWSGDVAPIGTRDGMRFEKGFISHVTLDKSTLGLKREMWDAALESPYWATVLQLDISDRVPDWWLREFLRSARSARIRRKWDKVLVAMSANQLLPSTIVSPSRKAIADLPKKS